MAASALAAVVRLTLAAFAIAMVVPPGLAVSASHTAPAAPSGRGRSVVAVAASGASAGTTWAVSVSGNWRVTFKFVGKDADAVDYEDYH